VLMFNDRGWVEQRQDAQAALEAIERALARG